jgi:hypothetical protein
VFEENIMFIFLRKGIIVFARGVNRFYAYAKANYERMGAPDPEPFIFALLTAFNTALEATKDGGKLSMMEKNAARVALTKALRPYCKEYLLNNSKVTEEDRIEMGMHVPKTTRTETAVPDTIPIVVVITSMIRQLSFMYWELGLKRAGKPPKVAFFVLHWALLDHYPSGLEELVNVTESSKPPLTLTFGDKDRGKTLYFVVSWRIVRGCLEGPRSQIMMAIVP